MIPVDFTKFETLQQYCESITDEMKASLKNGESYTTNEVLNHFGYYKVTHEGCSFVVGKWFNPQTKHHIEFVLRDYEYDDGRADNDSLYNASIDETALKAYNKSLGYIVEGDTVEVFKGRKVPKGIYTVAEVKPFYDMYNRVQGYYAYLTNGMRTNVDNCKVL